DRGGDGGIFSRGGRQPAALSKRKADMPFGGVQPDRGQFWAEEGAHAYL
ncbi:unnamed protein product, partial [marine sediment metagenome]